MKPELRPISGLTKDEQHVLGEINELLARGIDRFAEVIAAAAKKFMTLADATREKLKHHPNPAHAAFAASLERVAAREMHPRLAISSGLAARQIARLDYSAQEHVIEDLIPVALPNGDSIRKSFEALSRDEIAQVFDTTQKPPALRDLGGQRAWLAAKKLAEQKKARAERNTKLIVVKGKYRIANTHFFPLKDRFTMKELEAILADMKRLRA